MWALAESRHVEVNTAIGFVGQALFDQSGNELDDLWNVLAHSSHHIRQIDLKDGHSTVNCTVSSGVAHKRHNQTNSHPNGFHVLIELIPNGNASGREKRDQNG